MRGEIEIKIQWVELHNWRRHVKTRINFFDDATVIYGSNEKGKSTIMEAMSRGFFDKTNSHNMDIKRIKPKTSHGNVTSQVRLQFTIKQTKYLVEKNFNFKAGTALYEIINNKPILRFQEDADEELIKLLEADLPSKGRISKPSQWGAFQWLWALQDHIELPEKTDGDPTAALHLEKEDEGKILATPKFQNVLNQVKGLYSQYFYKNGNVHKSSPVHLLEKKIITLNNQLDELEKEIRDVDFKKQSLEELKQKLPKLEVDLKNTKIELKEARIEAMDFSTLKAELKVSKTSVENAERDMKDSKNALKELDDIANEIESFQKKEKHSRENFSRIEAIRGQLEKNLKEKLSEIDQKAIKIREAEELAKDARILWKQSNTENEMLDLNKKLMRIKKIEKKVENLRKEEKSILPDNEEIEVLIQAKAQIDGLNENLKLRGLKVNVIPGINGSLNVNVDGNELDYEELTATGTESIIISAAGLGNVTVTASLIKARDIKIRINELNEIIKAELRKYAVNSIEELKDLNRNQNSIKQEIKEFDAERRGIDERSLKEIIIQVDELNKKLDEYKKMERTPISIDRNPIIVELGKLIKNREIEEKIARDAVDKAMNEKETINKEIDEKFEEFVQIKTEKELFSNGLENARNRERELIRKFGSIQNQEKLLNERKTIYDNKIVQFNNIKLKYENLEKGPINRIDRLEKQIESQEQIIKQHQTSIDELNGRISFVTLDGAYSKLSETISQLEILNERFEYERINEQSLKLLKETLENQYISVVKEVVDPIKEEVKKALIYVTGSLHENIELNEFLFPVKVNERGFNEEIELEFDDSSTGLKDLLAICVRLAVAKHLSEKDSQCLVLDDPFVNISSERSNRMIELMNNAIRDNGLQIIVFTLRETEFSGFGPRMINIETAKTTSK